MCRQVSDVLWEHWYRPVQHVVFTRIYYCDTVQCFVFFYPTRPCRACREMTESVEQRTVSNSSQRRSRGDSVRASSAKRSGRICYEIPDGDCESLTFRLKTVVQCIRCVIPGSRSVQRGIKSERPTMWVARGSQPARYRDRRRGLCRRSDSGGRFSFSSCLSPPSTLTPLTSRRSPK